MNLSSRGHGERKIPAGAPDRGGSRGRAKRRKKRRRESERARFLRLGKCRVSWCLLFREAGSFRFDGADLRDLGCSLVSFYYALAPFLLTAARPFSSFCLRLGTASPPPLRVSFLSSSAPVKRAPFSPFPWPFRLRTLLVCFFPPCPVVRLSSIVGVIVRWQITRGILDGWSVLWLLSFIRLNIVAAIYQAFILAYDSLRNCARSDHSVDNL